MTPVGMFDINPALGEGSQVIPGLEKNLAVDVDARHLSWTHDAGQERGVVAGACSDFQDPQARGEMEVLEHLGHQRGLAGRADRSSAPVPGWRAQVRNQGAIGINETEVLPGRFTGIDFVPAVVLAVKLIHAVEKLMPRRGAESRD